jgi:hypothetical protein
MAAGEWYKGNGENLARRDAAIIAFAQDDQLLRREARADR